MLKDDNAAASSTLDVNDANVARWQAIAAQLRADILAGRVAPGERLPNETALAERFGVNRHTLRQAVQALVREGHLDVRQGCGTFVRELVLDYALQRRTRLSENLARMGETAGRELLSHAVLPAGEWAQALKLPARAKVVVLETRSSVRGRRVGLSTAAFPCPRLAGIAAPVAPVADAGAYHRQSDLGRAQQREAGGGQGRGMLLDQRARRMRQHGQPALACARRGGVRIGVGHGDVI